MTGTGTYEEVEKILNQHGLKRIRGVKPTGLLFELAEMLNMAYIKGYSEGSQSLKVSRDKR